MLPPETTALSQPLPPPTAAGRVLRAWLALLAWVGAAVLLAIGTSRIWNLEPRWALVVIGLIVGLSIAMMLLGRLASALVLGLFALSPLAGIERWIFPSHVSPEDYGPVVFAGTLGIGPVTVLVAAIVLVWAARVFVMRLGPVLVLHRRDGWALALVAAYLLSMWGTPDLALALLALGWLLKHLIACLFVSRFLEWRHLRPIVGISAATLLLQAALAFGQVQFGVLQGFARDKGADQTERKKQYEVPGIESRVRAEGTAYDSHALGLVLNMALPLALLTALARQERPWLRLLCLGALVAGCAALVLTYSRSAWVCFALVLALLAAVVLFRWRDQRVIPLSLAAAVPISLALPWVLARVGERFSSAPWEIMTERFGQYEVALDVWRSHPLFGFGVGNYMEALGLYNTDFALELPVHNTALWLGAEVGVFGVVAFFGLVGAASLRLWRTLDHPDELTRRFALAGLGALAAYVLDGMGNPLFREPVVFISFWLWIGIAWRLGDLSLPRRPHPVDALRTPKGPA